MATDDYPAPPFDEGDADMPESYDSFWDAVPVDLSGPAPPAVEAPAGADPEPVAVHPPEYTPPPADEPTRPVTLHVEQSDVG